MWEVDLATVCEQSEDKAMDSGKAFPGDVVS